MDSRQYRERAEQALALEGLHQRPKPEQVAEAAVWAQLATAAAIEESSSKGK